jgi:hypothetical protein
MKKISQKIKKEQDNLDSISLVMVNQVEKVCSEVYMVVVEMNWNYHININQRQFYHMISLS